MAPPGCTLPALRQRPNEGQASTGQANVMETVVTGPFGGSGGGEFTDPEESDLTGLRIRAGAFVDGIQVQHGAAFSDRYGGGGGEQHSLLLEEGEYIIAAEGEVGEWGGLVIVSKLRLTTSKGKSLTFGCHSGEPFIATPPAPSTGFYYLAGIRGRCGAFVDALTFVWRLKTGELPAALDKPITPTLGQPSTGRPTVNNMGVMETVVTGPFGGLGGGEFADPEESDLTGLRIRAGAFVDGIQVQHGAAFSGWYGGRGGMLHSLRLEEGEYIIAAEGEVGEWSDYRHRVISKLRLTTSKEKSLSIGHTSGERFNATPPPPSSGFYYLAGIHGRCGAMVDALTFVWRLKGGELPAAPDKPATALAAQNDRDKMCPVCWEEDKKMVFQCGHQVCTTCEPSLQRCPICRTPITLRIRMY